MLVVAGRELAEGRSVAVAPGAALGVAVLGALLGGAAVVLARRAGARSVRGPRPRLGPEHDDAAGSALRARGSWLTTAGAVLLAPLVVLLLAPSGAGGLGDRPSSPSAQTTGRLVVAVMVLVAAVVVLHVALAAAHTAERRARAVLAGPSPTTSDDVRAVAAAVCPVALHRVGAAAAVGAQAVALGVLLAPGLGPAAPGAGVVVAAGLQALSVGEAVRKVRE